MSVRTRDDWQAVAQAVGFTDDADLVAMHIDEIEEEAGNVLDLLTVLRVDARQGDQELAEGTAAELTVALGHLMHHVQELLPLLEKQLDIEDTEELEEVEP